MENKISSPSAPQPGATASTEMPGLKSAVKLSALQLKAIRLDSRHTLLTPDYLEQLLNPSKGA